MDNRYISAVILSTLIVMIYLWKFPPHAAETKQATESVTTTQSHSIKNSDTEPSGNIKFDNVRLPVQTRLGKYEFNEKAELIKFWAKAQGKDVIHHADGYGMFGPMPMPKDLQSVTVTINDKPVYVNGRVSASFKQLAKTNTFKGSKDSVLLHFEARGALQKTVREYTLDTNRYVLFMQQWATGVSAYETRLILQPWLGSSSKGDHSIRLTEKNIPLDFTKTLGSIKYDNEKWIALRDGFNVALLACNLIPEDIHHSKFALGKKNIIRLGYRFEIKGNQKLKAAMYLGPKKFDRLQSGGASIEKFMDVIPGSLHVTKTMDWGFKSTVMAGMHYMLDFFRKKTGSFGLSIIILTLVLRIVLFPLNHISTKSMLVQKRLQPQLEEIKKRTKNNAQQQQKETMALYKREGVNPMGGCLPMVVQFPILIFMYYLLIDYDMGVDRAFLWIRDLGQGCDIHTPSSLILLGVYTVLMIAQQKLSPQVSASSDDPNMKMMKYMPYMFIFILWSMPAAVVLYWTFSSLFALLQQLATNAMMKQDVAVVSEKSGAMKKKGSKEEIK